MPQNRQKVRTLTTTSSLLLDNEPFKSPNTTSDRAGTNFGTGFAVNWLRHQGDIYVLSRYMGHSRIQNTMEYLKIVPMDQGRELMKITFD
jgi:hypothetical protein